jgi:hypothetical protein
LAGDGLQFPSFVSSELHGEWAFSWHQWEISPNASLPDYVTE